MTCPYCGRQIITDGKKNNIIFCPFCTVIIDENFKHTILTEDDFEEFGITEFFPNIEKTKLVDFSNGDQNEEITILVYGHETALFLITVKRKDYATKRNIFDGSYFPSEKMIVIELNDMNFLNRFNGICTIETKDGKRYTFADIYDDETYYTMVGQ
jgi:hypothetical protein